MQAKQMVECLQKLAPLVDGLGAEALLRTAEGLRSQEAKGFGNLATKLGKRLTEMGLPPIKTASSELLDRMAEVGRVGGANTLSKDFFAAARVIELLGSLDAARIPQVLTTALAPPPKKPTAPKVKVVPVDSREAADRLTAETLDGARFEALIKEFSKLSKVNLAEIAQHYLGYSRQYKSKPDILKAIRSRQLQDALDASREDRGSKISV